MGTGPAPMRTHGSTPSTKADSFRRFEVITGVGRRRRWTDEEKARIVAESLDPATTASAVARRYGLHVSQLFTWRQQLQRGAAAAALGEQAFVPVLMAEDGPARAEPGGRIEGSPSGLVPTRLAGVQSVAPRHRQGGRGRVEALGHDPRLILVRPAAASADAGDHLHPAEAVGLRTGRTTISTHRSRTHPHRSGPTSSTSSADPQGGLQAPLTL